MIPNKVYNLLFDIMPLIILFVIAISSIRIVTILYSHEEFVIHREIKNLIYILYIFVLFILVTSTDFESYSNNFIPFAEISRYTLNSKLFFRNVIGNILLFFPFGYLVTDLIQSKAKKCNLFIPILISTITSTSIEIIQMFIGRSFDIDDIILNVIGGFTGYLIYKIFHLIINPFRKKYNESVVIFISSILIILLFLALCYICHVNGVLL